MFIGINNGVVAKLKREFRLAFVELNTCVAHSFALVGYQAGLTREGMNYLLHAFTISSVLLEASAKQKKRLLISKLEGTIGKIYLYFGSSANRTSKLKYWQNLLDIPELKFKRLFHIRWTAIRDSTKPIMLNITPGKYL